MKNPTQYPSPSFLPAPAYKLNPFLFFDLKALIGSSEEQDSALKVICSIIALGHADVDHVAYASDLSREVVARYVSNLEKSGALDHNGCLSGRHWDGNDNLGLDDEKAQAQLIVAMQLDLLVAEGKAHAVKATVICSHCKYSERGDFYLSVDDGDEQKSAENNDELVEFDCEKCGAHNEVPFSNLVN